MKRQLFSLLIAVLACTGVQAQSCPDSLILSTQNQVDSFPIAYGGCTAIPGNLTISGNDITKLDSLIGLISIGGNLIIDSNIDLSTLSGLDSLTSIGSDLLIIDNASLLHLNGIRNLAFIGGKVEIVFNGNLTTLAPFKNLKSLAGDVLVWGNALESLSGLDSLRFVGGSLSVSQNDALTNLHGLHNLDSVGRLAIRGNLGLADLSGLDNLRVVQHNAIISGIIFSIPANSTMTSLQGLNNLTTVGGNLEISHHPLLLDLSGLDALNSIGGLHIAANPLLSDLSSLSVLDFVDTIGGDVTIDQNASMTSLAGLENIAVIGGTLKISANPLLPDLSGLDALNSIVGLHIAANPLLSDLSSLSVLDFIDTIGGDVTIDQNASMTSLAGLENIVAIGGRLDIWNNPLLTDFSGLDSLKTIGNNLILQGIALDTLNVLNHLDSIGAGLWIANNPDLVSVQGFESLDVILALIITNNPVLSDVSALNHPITMSGDLWITENPLLGVCAVQSVCDYLDDPPGNVTIHTNAPGCNFPTEVLAVCKGFSNVIQGTLFWDEGNCLYDSTEQIFPQWLVKAEGNSLTYYAITDTAGHFSILVDTGSYMLGVQLPSNLWALCDTIQVAFSDPLQLADTAIGIQTVEFCPLMNVDIAVPFLRRCFENFYTVDWVNQGTDTAFAARVEIRLDTLLDVNTASLPDPWTDLGGNKFSIALGDVPPLARGRFTVGVTPNCAGTQNGQTKCVEAHIFPNILCIPPIGWDGSDLVVTAICTGESVLIRIRNAGNGDMALPSYYIIIEDVVLGIHEEGLFQLMAGQDTIITIPAPANGEFLRIEVEQSPGHPFSKIATASVEGCPDFVSPTIFLQYPQDESSPFVAVDCHTIIGSWDPNDKQAFPQGLDSAQHYILNDTEIEYLVRFQNTGTDTAFHIVIRDTLSPSLDVATVRPGAASHSYRFEIVSGNVLKFIFDDILLPDSTTNEAASHGFVQFRIAQRQSPANQPNTVIENRAAIYFDYNAPVLTNTVFHTVAGPIQEIVRDTVCDPAAEDLLLTDTARYSYFQVVYQTLLSGTVYGAIDTLVCLGDTIYNAAVLGPLVIIQTLPSVSGCDSILTITADTLPAYQCVSSTKILADAALFQLFPNPTSRDLTVAFPSSMPRENTILEIRHASGRLCLSHPLPSGASALTLPVSTLPAGAYFVVVRSPAGIWGRRFVKIE